MAQIPAVPAAWIVLKTASRNNPFPNPFPWQERSTAKRPSNMTGIDLQTSGDRPPVGVADGSGIFLRTRLGTLARKIEPAASE